MKRLLAVTTVLVALGSWAAAGEIAFVDTYQNALSQAKAGNQNMIITFYADW
jgi:hypothetical protein